LLVLITVDLKGVASQQRQKWLLESFHSSGVQIFSKTYLYTVLCLSSGVNFQSPVITIKWKNLAESGQRWRGKRIKPPMKSSISKHTGSNPSSRHDLMAESPDEPAPMISTRFTCWLICLFQMEDFSEWKKEVTWQMRRKSHLRFWKIFLFFFLFFRLHFLPFLRPPDDLRKTGKPFSCRFSLIPWAHVAVWSLL